MPGYRSHRTAQGRTQAVARALWRATGTAETDLAKPIVAIATPYTQFVPGHVHLKPLGELVAEEIRAGAVAEEFPTIAVDDGIAMGHEGMLYSLPSRERIADGAALTRSASHGAVRGPSLVEDPRKSRGD